MKSHAVLLDDLLNTFEQIRYVAIRFENTLSAKQREYIQDSSSSESDKYEELLVNPLILTAARQRGDIDCGGLQYVLIRYGSFYQLIREIPQGHISICLTHHADLNNLPVNIFEYIKSRYPTLM